jgi:hypothetical protein
MRKVLFIFLLLCSNAYATNVTIQQGVFGTTTDSYLKQDNPTVSQEGNFLNACNQFPGTHQSFPIIEFDLSFMPSNATITSATLSMYYSGNGLCEGPNVGVYRVFKPWTSATTWNSWDGSSLWTIGGAKNASDSGVDNSGNGSGADIVSTATASFQQTSCSELGWNTFNLTTAVQNWVSGAWANNGVSLGIVSGRFVCDTNLGYYSSEYTTDTTLRPKLDITYTTPFVPVTTNATIRGSATVKNATIK